MNAEIKKYIDKRFREHEEKTIDLVVMRSATYFHTMEKIIADMAKNLLVIADLVKKIVTK